jgi:hypothetical protein
MPLATGAHYDAERGQWVGAGGFAPHCDSCHDDQDHGYAYSDECWQHFLSDGTYVDRPPKALQCCCCAQRRLLDEQDQAKGIVRR